MFRRNKTVTPCYWILLAIALCSILLTCKAGATVTIVERPFSIDLSLAVDALEDSTHTLRLADVLSSERWVRNQDTPINYGIQQSTWWFRATLVSSLTDNKKIMVDVDSVFLDELTLTLVDAQNQPLVSYHTGDKLAFDTRPLPTRSFVFPLSLPAESTTTLILKVRHSGGLTLPLTLHDEQSFWLHERTAGQLDGAIFALMLVMLFYNFIVWLLTRESGYGYYVVYIAIFTLTLACHNGYAFQYLWPANPAVYEFVMRLVTGLVIVAAVRFNVEILALKTRLPWLWRISVTAMVILLLLTVWATFIAPYTVTIKIYVLSMLASIALMHLSAWCVAVRGDRIARYYLIAWTPLLLAFCYYALHRVGFLSLSADPFILFKLTISIEAVLFSLVLAARIQLERDARQQAQYALYELEKRSNRELEDKVQQRTQELQQALQELNALSMTDQLTGLKNRRYFDQQYIQDWRRCQRDKLPLAVILLDLDHFKKINDRYGHQVGDQVLQSSARIITQCVNRPADYICRYGGEEFVIVLPGTDLPGALHIAETIRVEIATTPIEVGEQSLSVTISIGVVRAIPDSLLNPGDLITTADIALYQAKRNGRNRVEASFEPIQVTA